MTEHESTDELAELASLGSMFAMDGDIAVVTGGSSGIGQAAAEVIAQAGATVAIVGRDQNRLDAVREGIEAAGGTAYTFVADVSERGQITAVMERVRDEIGQPTVVVANAGIGAGPNYRMPGGSLAEYSEEIWDHVVATNLTGVFETLRAGAGVIADGGRMLVTASTAGLRADPMVGYAYVATKAAVLNMVRQAALEFAPRGIRVNAIAPGPFRTRIGGDRPVDPEREKVWASTVPLGRMGDTRDLKGPILLLVSPASAFVTGATLPVDGGALALSHTSF